MKITKDIEFRESGGMSDLFDNAFKAGLNLTDDEYDYIAEHMTDEESMLLVNDNPTFTQKREVINIRSKYLRQYYQLD